MTTASTRVPAAAHKMDQTVGYCVAFVALGLVTASLGPTISDLAAYTQTALSEISILFAARSLGYLVGSFFGGRVYDRVSGHPAMALALGLMAVAMALVPVVPLLWLLVALLLVIGAAEGAVDVGGNALLVWVHGSQVGPSMNALHFAFGVGAFLSPILIAQVVQLGDGLRWVYWSLALLMLPAVAWVARIPSPRPGMAGDEREAGRSSLWLVALFVTFFFLYVGAEVSFGGWLYTYGVVEELANPTAAAYLTSAFWGALTVGRLLAIPIAARLRPHTVLLGDLVGCVLSVGMMLAWPHSRAALWVGALGVGLSMASIFPTMMSLAERLMTVTGRITGWFLVASSAGGMFLPWLIGQYLESVGTRVVMVAIGIDLAVTILIWAALTFGWGSRARDVRQE